MFQLAKMAVATSILALLLAPAALAEATSTTEKTIVPFSGSVFNSCAGELVFVEGHFILVAHTTVDAAGGAHTTFRIIPVGVSGTSATGTRYVLVSAQGGTHNESGPAETSTDTGARAFRVISAGSTQNTLLHITAHMTFNASGEPTSQVFNERFECAG